MVDDLKALERRVNKGFDWCREREMAGQTDADYERWFTEWERLLRKYEAVLQGKEEP